MILEILGQEKVPDEQAALHFFQDLSEANGVTSTGGWKFSTHATMPSIASKLPKDASILGGAGKQLVAQGRDIDIGGNPRHLEAKWVRGGLCVIRLPHVTAEVLVTLTSPGEVSDAALTAPNETFVQILQSIRFVDWSLFG